MAEYRIVEHMRVFTIEKELASVSEFSTKRTTEWHPLTKEGLSVLNELKLQEILNRYSPYSEAKTEVGKYETLEEARAQIKLWQSKPIYHEP